MKAFFISAAVVLSFGICANALYWSRSENIQEGDAPLLSEKLAAKQTVFTFCVSPGKNVSTEYSEEELILHIRAAFKRWTLGGAATLKKHPRAKEFKDIIKLLSTKIKLQYLGLCNIDELGSSKPIRQGQPDIALVKGRCFGDTAFFVPGKHPFICLGDPVVNTARAEATKDCFAAYASGSKAVYNCRLDDIKKGDKTFPQSIRVVTHELGHAFGLDDEYFIKDKKRTPKSSTVNRGDGIMSHESQDINLDDIEGLITILDKYTQTKRTINPSLAHQDGAVKDGDFYTKEEFILMLKQSRQDIKKSSGKQNSPFEF